MSDVLDIIHRLTYQVDNSQLQSVLSTLKQNTSEVGILQASIAKLENQLKSLSKTDQSDIQIRKQVIAQIELQKQKIDQLSSSIAKYATENEAALRKELGLINVLVLKQQELLIARNKSSNIDDIIKYNQQLKITADELTKISGLQDRPIDYGNVKEGLIGASQRRLAALQDALPFANSEADIKAINREMALLQSNLVRLQSLGQRQGLNAFNNSLDKTKNSSSTASLAILNLGRIIQDAPFGFLGIANNLNPALEGLQRLSAESKATGTSISSNLIGSLTGAAGLGLALSVVSSLLIVFGDELFNTSKDADKATESYRKFLDTVAQTNLGAVSAANAEIDKLNILNGIINAGNASQEQKAAAIKEIQSLYPGLSKEAILQGDVLKQIRQQIIAKENSNALSKDANESRALEAGLIREVAKAQEALTKAEVDLNKARKKKTGSTASEEIVASAAEAVRLKRLALEAKQIALDNNRTSRENLLGQSTNQAIKAGGTFFGPQAKDPKGPKGPDPYKVALEQAEAQANIAKETDKALQLILATEQSNVEVYKLILEQDAEQGITRSLESRAAREQEYKRQQERINAIESIRILELEKGLLLNKSRIAGTFNKAGDQAKFNNEIQQVDIKLANQKINLILSGEVIPSIDVNNSDINFDEVNKKVLSTRRGKNEIKELKADQITPDKKDVKKELDEIADLYKNFSQTLAGIFQGIYQRQVELLDNEISIREKRVDYALTLAERGNTELLNLEKKRLEEAQKQREKAANKEAAINAALTLSNSILAIAQAAGETGAGAIVVVPAVIAALAAGFAAVSALSQENSFKDGVVGLQGPGTEKSDSIPARLSKGESVITAEATRRYGPMLTAMNAGLPVPYTATLNQNGNYVTKREFAEHGEKLDAIVEAVRDSKLYQKINMDKRGLSIMTQQELRRYRNSFL